jgi:hypothetical protein
MINLSCLGNMNLKTYKEAIYSFVYILLSRNQFKLGYDILQTYHLTSSGSNDFNLNKLINVLNTEIEFIKWKEAIQSNILRNFLLLKRK